MTLYALLHCVDVLLCWLDLSLIGGVLVGFWLFAVCGWFVLCSRLFDSCDFFLLKCYYTCWLVVVLFVWCGVVCCGFGLCFTGLMVDLVVGWGTALFDLV